MIMDLSDFPIFSDLPDGVLQDIMPLLKERQFKKNHILMFENDESDEVYLIRSGMLKVYRLHEGKEIVLSIAVQGEIIGEVETLSNDTYRISSVEALEQVTVWQMKKQDFLEIAEKYPTVIRKAYMILVERVRILNRLIRYLTFYDVRTKVANLIVDFYFNFGRQTDKGYYIELKINQSLLANMLGVTRESVSKTLTDFQDEKIIDIRDKYFYILDMEKLESLCEETEEIQTLRKWYKL
ncbi:Crp/Fnr family transcriptional regulator [Neobacillus piezotolerans]|uniref:Crp/Fnr family transcriptional regulator n=1 Tax=Neobacillus piezotolerans TaxID=2259171 RepID=A0A3D8GSD1_9BACI|nr:Crp/Fnr family transcriptional regulator [Neobacillus piezotolerans]RDU37365.1 Crp/Fnr family transcriptional regulator [Neobacillus piezotolerans]